MQAYGAGTKKTAPSVRLRLTVALGIGMGCVYGICQEIDRERHYCSGDKEEEEGRDARLGGAALEKTVLQQLLSVESS